MKRFSVLLVVVIFLIPLVVYGLSGNFDRDFFDKGQELNQVPTSHQSHSQVNLLQEDGTETEAWNPERPFLFPEPDGVKGVLKDINFAEMTLQLEKAEFYNPITESVEIADFTIKINADTSFVHDMQVMTDLNHLTIGQRVICQGITNYATKTMTLATHIFSGNMHTSEALEYVPIDGHIVSIEDNVITFIGLASPNFDLGETFQVRVSSETRCLKKKISDSEATLLPQGVIPDFVTSGTNVHGIVTFRFGDNIGSALDLVFFDNE